MDGGHCMIMVMAVDGGELFKEFTDEEMKEKVNNWILKVIPWRETYQSLSP